MVLLILSLGVGGGGLCVTLNYRSSSSKTFRDLVPRGGPVCRSHYHPGWGTAVPHDSYGRRERRTGRWRPTVFTCSTLVSTLLYFMVKSSGLRSQINCVIPVHPEWIRTSMTGYKIQS